MAGVEESSVAAVSRNTLLLERQSADELRYHIYAMVYALSRYVVAPHDGAIRAYCSLCVISLLMMLRVYC